MHLAPAKPIVFTDPHSGSVLFSAPTPCLAQIEDCIRLEPDGEKHSGVRSQNSGDGGKIPEPESAVARQRRMLAQCRVLLCPPVLDAHSPLAWWQAWRHRRRAERFLRGLQYPQLLDLYRKLMLAVQGVDFDTVEEFERALEAQKKSTRTAPPNPATPSSNGSSN